MNTHEDADPDGSDEDQEDGEAPEPHQGAIAVEVSDNQTHLSLAAGQVEALVHSALAANGIENASVSVVLVDDATIHDINRRHLGHDWPTDVITFPLSGPGEPELCGELVVSAEMAATTALETGVDPRDELALYLVHGLLHLCGLDDTTPGARDEMRRREDETLAALGLRNTFPSVAAQAGDEAGRESVRWTG